MSKPFSPLHGRRAREAGLQRGRPALADLELFTGLDDRTLDWVGSLCTQVTVSTGQLLTVEGGPGRQAFVIRSGRVSLTAKGSIWQTLGQGDLLGEMALLDGGLRSATAKTVGETTLLVFNPQEFASLLGESQVRARVRATADTRRWANIVRDGASVPGSA